MRKVSSTNSINRHALAGACVLNEALARLALRWKMPVLNAIAHGAGSYAELRIALPDITHQMLATRLRELVAEGLVMKVSGDVRRAPRYITTASAHEVLAIMEDICRWEKRRSALAR